MNEDQKKIQQLEREISLLKEIAHKDELTRLYNRRGFSEESNKFTNEVVGFERTGPAVGGAGGKNRKNVLIRNFSLIIFDIDKFKTLNDTYGHQAGDEALKLFSQLVKSGVRDIDVVARWGGEEVIVGLVGADLNDAFRVADNIRQTIEAAELDYEGKKIKFTVSGGAASLDQVNNFDELFKLADDALYRAKESGRNRIEKNAPPTN